MTFEEVLDQAIGLLQRRGRVTYRTLQRQFQLDDEALKDLKDELLYAHPEVRDDAGRGLLWSSDTGTAPPAATALAGTLDQAPLAYTPTYLAEKILTSRSALEGERKQVTVFFADLKDSTRLIEGLDPEVAQQLLDPALHLMMEAVHRFEGTVNQVLGDGIIGIFAYPPKRYIPEILPHFTGLPAKSFLPFLRVFLDDMSIGEIQIDGGGAEPIMLEYFLDGCQ
jgi:hypothetical protein